MYARVAKFEHGDAEAVRSTAEEIKSTAESGPPPGVPATGFLMLIDPDNGRSMGIAFFATEEDLQTGDKALDAMSPPGNMGQRTSVEMYEVAIDMRV